MCYLGDGEHDVSGCHQGLGASLQLVANHLGKHQADWLAQHDSFCFDPTHTCMEWQYKIMLSLFLTTSLRQNSMSLTGNEPSYNVVLVQSYISKKSNYLFSISFHRIFSKCFSKCGTQTPVSKSPWSHTKWSGVQESPFLMNTTGNFYSFLMSPTLSSVHSSKQRHEAFFWTLEIQQRTKQTKISLDTCGHAVLCCWDVLVPPYIKVHAVVQQIQKNTHPIREHPNHQSW